MINMKNKIITFYNYLKNNFECTKNYLNDFNILSCLYYFLLLIFVKIMSYSKLLYIYLLQIKYEKIKNFQLSYDN